MTFRLDDGYQSLITFASFPSVKFYEKTVTPPGVDGGGEIDTSTMQNSTWRTRSPKALITLSPASVNVAYDPDVYPTIISMVNVNQVITITFSDTSTLAFWGWLNTFTPGAMTEGEQPTADAEIIPSNQNAALAETAPTETPGTTTTTTTAAP